MVVVVTRVQLKHRVDPPGLIESLDLFRILPNVSQDRGLAFALFVSKRKVHIVRQTLWLVEEDVLLHFGKPERAGYAAYTGKQVRLVDGIQRKQPSQRVFGNFMPIRDPIIFFSVFKLCLLPDNLL